MRSGQHSEDPVVVLVSMGETTAATLGAEGFLDFVNLSSSAAASDLIIALSMFGKPERK